MKKIGIIPAAGLFETDDPYKDIYRFVNNFPKRVYEHGGIPFGILSQDGYIIEKSLDMADALLICGGNKVYPYHLQAVEHAVKHGKKLLGICLGMQSIHMYFTVADEMKKRNFNGTAVELFDIMKKEKHMFTLPVAHHWDVSMVRGCEEKCKHSVKVYPSTLLHSIVNNDIIYGASMHNYAVNNISSRLTVNACAEDGTIEGIEHGDNILGVQFHPEVDDKLSTLFDFLCK